ncbi:Methyl jasmonate esterase 1 [Linum grandiflorum]
MTMKHFVLVHGACHGAWCWYKVSAELKQAGHKVTALDMAACGINPTQIEDVHSLVDYSEPLLNFLASLTSKDDKVILVGHSMNGFSLCIAMERFPNNISLAVFVAANMLSPDLTYEIVAAEYAETSSTADYMDSQVIFGNGVDKPPTAVLLGPKYMETKTYRHSPVQDLELALTLVRPSPIWETEQAAKDTVLTNDNFGKVPRAFVVCDEERDGKFQWWLINNNPPDDYIVIQGSDHMVMFSKPGPLSTYLLQLGDKYI